MAELIWGLDPLLACGTASHQQHPHLLDRPAQQVFHRPTGACHTNHIIPPSRLWAG
jgi:hypothetical protein